MQNRQASPTGICILCGKPATGEAQSKEHIIPAALGGWKTVSGFICRGCNSETGHTWDATLGRDLEDLARLLNISRERGPVSPKTVRTSQGLPIRVAAGNRIQLAHPDVREFSEGSRKGARVIAGSTDELRRVAQTINRRRPLTEDIETLLANRGIDTGYLREGIPYTINNPGTAGNKSMVKSALALIFDAGIDPACADDAVAFLKDDEAANCVFPYYVEDPVTPRVAGMPLNCVYIKGDANKCVLTGYVEFFGFLRRVIRLSSNYGGKQFEHYYALDPTDGSEQRLAIHLDATTAREAEHQPDPQQEKRVIMEAVQEIVWKAKEASDKRELDRLTRMAVAKWFNDNGKGADETLTDEECRSLAVRIAQAVAPFLIHMMTPMELPEDVARELRETAESGDKPSGTEGRN